MFSIEIWQRLLLIYPSIPSSISTQYQKLKFVQVSQIKTTFTTVSVIKSDQGKTSRNGVSSATQEASHKSETQPFYLPAFQSAGCSALMVLGIFLDCEYKDYGLQMEWRGRRRRTPKKFKTCCTHLELPTSGFLPMRQK